MQVLGLGTLCMKCFEGGTVHSAVYIIGCTCLASKGFRILVTPVSEYHESFQMNLVACIQHRLAS